ncbi:unnamed protein product [Kuraishia capsulata CBS 1993]|uniref:RRM domain-containing protein n=1 Tax=Kuraishia capsulata CBS 1993 TaxID=1382522 RepID=W6MVW1_9ASCO|nr:uncharacterized protein KUCA_T00002568001 [Kuraishia capsulata CBS 1993]CDK26595.1 unnamed protein product [Kuraishia capsulata CBS 1993]
MQTGSTDFLNTIPLPNPPEISGASSNVTPKTLWMGDLEPWWDEDYITSIWSAMNKRVLVKVIKPKQNFMHTSLFNHSGYCFVEFDTYEEAKEGLSLNGSAIPNSNGKVFRLNWASGATLDAQIPQTPEFSLFVGDLSPSTTEAHLLALFQHHFSSVKTVRVMTDPTTGSSRCFGFVRFTSEEDRRRALNEMNGVWLGDRPIRVALATPKHQNLGLKTNGSDERMFLTATGPPPHVPGQVSVPYYATAGVPLPQMGQHGGAPPQSLQQSQVFNDPNNTTVFVGGLANGVPEETLITLFEPFGSIVQVKIPPGKGCGFVKFSKRQDAEQAIAGMQGFIIGGSRVRLSWGRSNNSNLNQQMMVKSYDGYQSVAPQQVAEYGTPFYYAAEMAPQMMDQQMLDQQSPYIYQQMFPQVIQPQIHPPQPHHLHQNQHVPVFKEQPNSGSTLETPLTPDQEGSEHKGSDSEGQLDGLKRLD